MDPTRERIRTSSGTSKISLLLFAGLYVIHFAVLCKYAVNVPFWDEWDNLPSATDWKWLLQEHNEHRILFTRLQILLLYKLNYWDLAAHQVINFLIYGVLLAAFIYLLRRACPRDPLSFFLGSCVFALSPLLSANHFSGFQSQFHFCLLFFFLAISFLFQSKPTWKSSALGALFCLAAMFSFSAMVAGSIVVLIAFVFWTLFGEQDKRRFSRLLLVSALLILGEWLWFRDFHLNPFHADPVSPISVAFWGHYTNLISLGFGFEHFTILLGPLCLILVLFPALWILRYKREGAASIAVSTGILGLLGSMAVISVGRSGMGVLNSKLTRYTEFGVFLIPLSVAAWLHVLEGFGRIRNLAVTAIWCYRELDIQIIGALTHIERNPCDDNLDWNAFENTILIPGVDTAWNSIPPI